LQVAVLGPVEITGWAQPPTRTAVVDIVTFLACHPDRPVSADRLRAALSAGADSDVNEQTLRSYLSHARRALGPGRIPDATGAGGYRLLDVNCDWIRFQQLMNAAASEATRAAELLADALELVRGHPFADGCAWADTEHLPATINTTIAAAATGLARLTLDNEPDRALHATRVGLDAHPTDETLSILALRAAAPVGRLRVTWEYVQANWATNDISLTPALEEWHSRLRGPDGGLAGKQ